MARSRSSLAILIDENCVTSEDYGSWLGYTKKSWWQVRMGNRRLPEHKIQLLAKILRRPVAEIRAVAEATFASKKGEQ